jgi:hypothetical protein
MADLSALALWVGRRSLAENAAGFNVGLESGFPHSEPLGAMLRERTAQ